MRFNSLQQFVQLRQKLTAEKAEAEERLAAINQVLGGAPAAATDAAKPEAPAVKRGGRRRRGRGGLSLRAAILEALSKGPLDKQELLKAVQDLGVRFNTRNPLNSMGVVLYGKNPRFQRKNGKFTLPAGHTPGSAVAPSNGKARKKRRLSPEGRARIAAAARARWAKRKAKR